MSKTPSDRPYIQAWLKRVERQLRGSGRISQIAMALSQKHGGEAEEWRRQLRDILEGQLQPSADLIADVDQMLARPSETKPPQSDQGRLF